MTQRICRKAGFRVFPFTSFVLCFPAFVSPFYRYCFSSLRGKSFFLQFCRTAQCNIGTCKRRVSGIERKGSRYDTQ